MPYTITVEQVRDGFSTSASDADLSAYVSVVDQADACLSAKMTSEAIGTQLKILGVRHLATMASDRGEVVEEQAVSGARRRYSEKRGGETGHMQALRSLDKFGCVLSTLNNNARIQFRAVGPTSA